MLLELSRSTQMATDMVNLPGHDNGSGNACVNIWSWQSFTVPGNLRIDWEASDISQQIQHAALFFEIEFSTQYTLGSFPLLTRYPGSVAIIEAFTEYMTKLQKVSGEPAALKTPNKSKALARRRSRRHHVRFFFLDSPTLIHCSTSSAETQSSNCVSETPRTLLQSGRGPKSTGC